MKEVKKLHNETLINFLGVNGADKCALLSEIDGPDAENINAIFTQATSKEDEKKYGSLFDTAYNLAVNELPAFQNLLDKTVKSKFGEATVSYNVYKLALEIVQKKGRPDCEIILITGFTDSLSKKRSKKDAPLGVHVVCFDKDGNLYKKTNSQGEVLIEQTLDKPITIPLPSLVNMVESFNKEIEKSIALSSDIISYELNDDSSSDNSEEVLNYGDDNTAKTKANGSHKLSAILASGNSIAISKKILGAGVSLTLAIALVIFGNMSNKINNYEELLSEYVPLLERYSEIEAYLNNNPDSEAILNELVDTRAELDEIHAALAKINFSFDSEKKTIVMDDNVAKK